MMQSNHEIMLSVVDPDLKIEVPMYDETITKSTDTFVKWGPNNRFPNELLTLSECSPSLNAIINGTKSFVKGNKISFNEVTHWAERVNRRNEKIEDIVEQLAHDRILFGGYAIQVIWNRLGDVAEIYVLPMEYLRSNEDNTKFWYNKRWGKYSSNSVEYDAWNPNERGDKFTQVFFNKNSGTRRVYPTSPQTGALDDIVSESIASKYVKNSLQSGLSARWIVNLPNSGKLTDDNKRDIEEAIKQKFCGVENAGGFMLMYSNTDAKLDITKLDIDNANEIFTTIRNEAKDNIFLTNSATPNLFGVVSTTTGFNEQEYRDAYNLYYRLVVYPIQQEIVRDLGEILGKEITIEPFDINLDNELNDVE